jgi:hypothetical protein
MFPSFGGQVNLPPTSVMYRPTCSNVHDVLIISSVGGCLVGEGGNKRLGVRSGSPLLSRMGEE